VCATYSPAVLYGPETWPLRQVLREEHGLRVFDNIVQRGKIRSKRQEVTGRWDNFITRSFKLIFIKYCGIIN
jgi:hypothetical protein